MNTSSLRVYLITHAPRKPQFWFVPVIPDGHYEGMSKYEKSIEYSKQRLIQWPAAWADEQIKLLGDSIDLVYFKRT